MASHVFVVDSRARKARIPTTPATYLNDILRQGCEKLGLDSSKYILKHNNKLVDLSRTLRLAGLPAGAQLDLVQGSRSPTVITVALQLPESDQHRRVTHKFPSTTSIWEILRVIETQEKLNFTERGVPSTQSGSGRLFYEMPALNVMNRELGSFVDLQKTLSQLGVNSGNVLLKLAFKNSDIPLEVAMQDISQYFKSDTSSQTVQAPPLEGPSKKENAIPNAQSTENSHIESPEDVDAVMADAPSGLSAPAEDDTMANHSRKEDQTAGSTQTAVPEQNFPAVTTSGPSPPTKPSVTVYAPSTSNTPRAASQAFNEADYVPTLEHATQHQARLLQETRNKRLASDAELAVQEKERKAKQEAVTSLRVRIRLPDQVQMETEFSRDNCTGKNVYDFVKSQMRAPDTKFSIRFVDSKGMHVVLPDDQAFDLITKAGWRGNVLVNMVWDASVGLDARRAPVLKTEVMGQAKTLEVNLNTSSNSNSEADKKTGGFLGNMFKKDGKDKPKMGAGEKEARLKNLLGFKKK